MIKVKLSPLFRPAAFIIFSLLLASCKKEINVDVKIKKEDTLSSDSKAKIEVHNVDTDDETAQKLAAFLRENLKNELNGMTENDRKFRFYGTDLNGDDKDEYFISFSNSYFCGSGGCTYLLLDNDMNLINRFTVTRTPVYRSAVKTNGWNELIVPGKDGAHVYLKYDGKKYPSNPTVVGASSVANSKDDLEIIPETETTEAHSF